MNKRIFDSIEEINKTFGVDVIIPDNMPDGCNIVAYEIPDITNVDFYKEGKDDFSHWSIICKGWCSYGNYTLEGEVFDDIRNGYEFIYLRLITKDKFTPECLLGVETTEGFISKLNQNIKYFVNIGYTTCDPRELQYYISDDSDETVSFEDYVKLFYDVEGVL